MKVDTTNAQLTRRRTRLRCGGCGRTHRFDPGSSQQTGAVGEVHTCPYCGFIGSVTEDADGE